MTRSIPIRANMSSSPSIIKVTTESSSNIRSSENQRIRSDESCHQPTALQTPGVDRNMKSVQTAGSSKHQPKQNPTKSSHVKPEAYTQPFLSFMSNNPTIFHAVSHVGKRLESNGFTNLSEREVWKITKGGKYFLERNGSSIIAFKVGNSYQVGNGASIIASHIDALATRLKPVSKLSTKAGYVQLGVAPYAGALNGTWWDRDLGIGGRVLVKNGTTGKIETRLVKLDWPIARIPTLAPHFGQAARMDGANKETEMVSVSFHSHMRRLLTYFIFNRCQSSAWTLQSLQQP